MPQLFTFIVPGAALSTALLRSGTECRREHGVYCNANEFNSLAQARSELVHILYYYLLHLLQHVDMLQGAHSPLSSSYRGLCLRKRRVWAVRQTTSPASSIGIKNEWNYPSTTLCEFVANVGTLIFVKVRCHPITWLKAAGRELIHSCNHSEHRRWGV